MCIPVQVGVAMRFLQTNLSKWLTRFAEHGIVVALSRAADNYEELVRMKRERSGEMLGDEEVLVNSMFEYYVLIFGLTMATIVFVVELAMVYGRDWIGC